MNHPEIDSLIWIQHTWLNRFQSFLLLLVMASFFAVLGWFLWGFAGIILLLLTGVFGVMMNTLIAPRMVMSLYGAKIVDPGQLPVLRQLLIEECRLADLPEPPQLYYIPSRLLNAFAVGTRNHSAIALSDGLLRELTVRELAGVIAHEISHIRNNDLWVMGLADMFSRTTTIMSWIGLLFLMINLPLFWVAHVTINWIAIVLLLFAPSLSALAQLALSRAREYNADLNAIKVTGDPEGLARALVKIEQIQGGWLERIFLPGRRVPMPSLLRTHPETTERVERLMRLKNKFQAGGILSQQDSALDIYDVFGRPVRRLPRWHISGLWH